MRAALLISPAVVILGAVACIRFSDDARVAPCDGAVEAAPACAACVAQECEEALAACRLDEACCEDYTCLSACAPRDAVCRDGCLDAPGRRAALVHAVDVCRRSRCGEACVQADDLSFGWPDPCQACLQESCWQEQAACALDELCEAYITCDATCWDPGCVEGCWFAIDPEGADWNGCVSAEGDDASDDTSDPYDDYWNCLYRQCEGACEQGTSWGCVGDYRWPAPRSYEDGLMKFSMEVVDYLSWAPIEGVTLSACRRSDVACDPPIATGLTSSDGFACLDLPIGGEVGFTGYFRMTHEDYITVDDQYGRPLFYSGAGIMTLISHAANDVFWASMDIELEPDRGVVTVGVWDCTWTSAPDVSFELSTADDLTIPFYGGEDGNFSFTQTQTASSGGGAFANVPVTSEPARVIARLAETGEIVGCHEVIVRAGARTHLTLYPFDEPNFGCPGGLP